MKRFCEFVLIVSFAGIITLIGYGISQTPSDPQACLSRPWLDTSHGC